MLGEICKRSEIPSNLRDTKSSLVNSDICDGLDYLDSGLCVADLKEGTVGWSEQNMKTWKYLHLFELSETPGPKKDTE